jgi:Ni,Fe-hydrogenase I small subunit
MSFLNRIASGAPTTAADALMNSVPLAYHTALMGPAGEMAVATAQKAAAKPFVLVVEGGIPTAFDGAACWAWTWSSKDVTVQEQEGTVREWRREAGGRKPYGHAVVLQLPSSVSGRRICGRRI